MSGRLPGIAGNHNTSGLDDLFDTTPARPAGPPRPVQLSAEMKMTLLSAIQEARSGNSGFGPPVVDAAREAKLEAAIADGSVVQAPINGKVTALIKKSEIDDPKTIFYRTSGGFAGTQYFGPIDV